jgi:Flp pilus assembly protein TadG
MIRIAGRRLRQFRRDESGIVLILVTLMMVPLLLIVAVAIDYSQALVVKRQLIGAVDAAALTVAQMPDLDDDEAQEKAEDYIKAHYPNAAIGSLKTFSVTRDNGTVDVSATAELDTTFLRIAGTDKLEVTVNSRAMMRQTKLEVVMVLDNTGSMADRVGGTRKIDALKTAADTLVTALFGNAATSPLVKIGLVPFANAVNIGSQFRGAAIMDTATPTALNTEQIIADSGYTNLFQAFDALGVSWRGCVRSRLGGFDLTDAPPTAGTTLFTPYFAPDEYDDRRRGSANSYLVDPGGTGDYKRYSFYLNNPRPSGQGSGANYNCPTAPIQPLTDVKATITNALAAMTPNGSTVVPEGLAWGWRVISPGAPFTQGVAYDDPETVKAIILLTDGINSVNGGTNGNYQSIFSSYGHAANGHIGATNGSNAEATLDGKLATLCQNVKANLDNDATDQDIVLYTIGFGITSGSSIDTLLSQCASDTSKYFNTPSTEELQSAFEQIALGLNKLRLAQ